MGLPGDPSLRVGYRRAFVSREFRAVFFGQVVSVTGTSVAAVALTILVYRRTGSPFLSALTFSLGFLPSLLVGGLLSGVVDRVRPRRLLTGCGLTSGLLAALMAWPAIPVPALLVLLFCIGMLSSLASGARGGVVRLTVSHAAYVPARSMLRLAAQTAQIGGNAVGGALVVAVGVSGAILINAASFLFAAALMRLVLPDYPNLGESTRTGVVRDSLRGARQILGIGKVRRLLLLSWLVPMFSVAPEGLAAPYVAARHGSTTLVGVWLVALPLGIVVGDIAGVRFLNAGRQWLLVAPAAAAGFIPYLVFVAQPSIPLALLLLVVAGACGFYSLGLDGRLRDAVPEPLFARTMALNAAGLGTSQGVGFALAGAVAQGIGSADAIAIAGGCGLTVTAALMGAEVFPGLRSRRR
jgi:MFS family permease